MLSQPCIAEEEKSRPLEIGVVPYQSARVLVNQYEPMRLYLEQIMGSQVSIYTASSFKQFLLNAQHGDYDLAISPAHFARILQKENKFTPLTRYGKGGRGWVMAAPGGMIKSADDMKGKILAVPFQLSLASIVCMTALKEKGLRPGTDFRILEVPSFESAILAIQKGEADAAISTPATMMQMSKHLQESVQPVLDTGEFVSLILLSHPRIDRKKADLIRSALIKFGNETDSGKQFMLSTGFGNMLPVTAKEMDGLERYLGETKRLLITTN